GRAGSRGWQGQTSDTSSRWAAACGRAASQMASAWDGWALNAPFRPISCTYRDMSGLRDRLVGRCCGRAATARMSGGYSLPVFVRARRLVMATVLVGLTAGLVGCGGSGDKPRTLPPLSTTPA